MTQPNWVVLEVTPHEDHTLDLRFADGTTGTFDMHPLLEDEYYAPLSALPLFMTARIECGTVAWSNELDIAPELLYEKCA